MRKRAILIITGSYLPGYKDGGPIRTIVNLVDNLGEEYDFKILTSDRDRDDDLPYPGIEANCWNNVGKAKVMYLTPNGFSIPVLEKYALEADVVYVTGFYREYVRRILFLKRTHKIQQPVVIASMGMFSPNALKIKRTKKELYLNLIKHTGLVGDVFWSVSSSREKADLQAALGISTERIFIAEDLPRLIEHRDENSAEIKKSKKKDSLDVVFLSRISPEKNLIYAIEVLQNVKCDVRFNIYGPIYNGKYWSKCEEELESLPPNIKWEYKGVVESADVVSVLRNEHVFLFPTLGENYGHVIFEALAAGCPCVISDQTPWSDFEKYGVGEIHSLDNKSAFVDSIQKYAVMDFIEFNKYVENAQQFALSKCESARRNTGYRVLFDSI